MVTFEQLAEALLSADDVVAWQPDVVLAHEAPAVGNLTYTRIFARPDPERPGYALVSLEASPSTLLPNAADPAPADATEETSAPDPFFGQQTQVSGEPFVPAGFGPNVVACPFTGEAETSVGLKPYTGLIIRWDERGVRATLWMFSVPMPSAGDDWSVHGVRLAARQRDKLRAVVGEPL